MQIKFNRAQGKLFSLKMPKENKISFMMNKTTFKIYKIKKTNFR